MTAARDRDTRRVKRSQITVKKVGLLVREWTWGMRMHLEDGDVEILMDGRRYRGLWRVEAGAMTVRLGALSKSTTIRGMENYPETLARWLVVQLVPDLVSERISA